MSPVRTRLSACLFALALTTCGGEGPRPTSLLLITVDTLRADHVLAGAGTPALEALAARGTVFTQAFAASSSTAPSHASILTGLYPGEHTVGTRNAHHVLHPAFQTLAEVLVVTGRRTGAIVSNPVLDAELGLDQGFDDYDDDLESFELNRDRTERTSERAVDLAIAWLERDLAQPFFLWLHLQDPHGPYLPPSSWACGPAASLGEDRELPLGADHSGHQAIPAYQVVGDERRVSQYTQRYACEVRHTDHQLGRLLRHLEARELDASTLVVLTSDHGEAFGEDEFWFAHGHSVGREQVQVPLVMAGPEVPERSVINVPVTNVSIYATIMDAFGMAPPEPVVGPSLLQVVADPLVAEPVFVESIGQIGVAYKNAFLRRDRSSPSGTDLFDGPNPNSGGFWKPLGSDVSELLDPLGPHSMRSAQELQGLLDDFAARQEELVGTLDAMRVEVPVTDEQRAELSAIGYLR